MGLQVVQAKQQEIGSAADLSLLASDYDRWGLTQEAEALRHRYREAVIRDLKAKVSAKPSRRRNTRRG